MMIFWWILILVPLLAVVWWATTTSRKRSVSEKEDPLKVLQDRYARGEIDKAEFEEKKKTLMG